MKLGPIIILVFLAGLSGCSGGGKDQSDISDRTSQLAENGTLSVNPESQGNGATATASSVDANRPNSVPVVQGTPATIVAVGAQYRFSPTVIDADHDVLSFAAKNKPGWMSFDVRTGQFNGNPQQRDIGVYENISLTVSDGKNSVVVGPWNVSVVVSANSQASAVGPIISGSPGTTAYAGQYYYFQASATSQNGAKLQFSISNLPTWAVFDLNSGTLAGTPGDLNVGLTGDILITVTDGVNVASLPAFRINVLKALTGTALLTWSAPTTRMDGTALTNLAGYRLYYGTSPNKAVGEARLNNPATLMYQWDQLPLGQAYFWIVAFDSNGVESLSSSMVSKVIVP